LNSSSDDSIRAGHTSSTSSARAGSSPSSRDGGQHFEASARAYDARRTAYLAAKGITVLRFPTDLIFRERDGVLKAIALALRIDPGPSPSSPPADVSPSRPVA
jgi:hypothetical protein